MKPQSLKKDYTIFTNIVVFGAILISLSVLFSSYRSLYKKSRSIVIHTADKAITQLNESLSYIENISNIIGTQIVEQKHITKKGIAEILLNTRPNIDPATKDIFTWTFFDFIDSNNYVIATSSQGILKNPILVTEERRPWIRHSRITPWKLLSSKIDIGLSSQKRTIPFGFGITDKNNKFIGIISFGIDAAKLQRKLELVSDVPYVTFALLDAENSIVSTSSNFDKNSIVSLSNEIKETNQGYGLITLGGKNFYFQPSKYQFKILIGIDRKMFLYQLRADFLPKALNTIYLIIFFLILLYFFRAKLLKPVLKLSEVANNISQGKLEVTVPRSDIAEVNSLALAIEKVKRFLIAEEEVKQSLKKGKDIAESANYNKTEFLSSTAHELKNMLSGIIGFSELLKMNLTAPSESIAEMKKREAENINCIIDIMKLGEESVIFINDILDINQAQTGDFKVDAIDIVDLKDIMFRSVNLMKVGALKERKNIITNINKNSEEKFIAEKLDPRRVKQIIVNIISNAIKYSPRNTEIKVSINHLSEEESDKINLAIERSIRNNHDFTNAKINRLLSLLKSKIENKNNKIAITIEDNGYGMNEEELKIAVQKYGRIQHDPNQKIDSTGLGLAIVRNLIEEQCGLLEIKSEKNKGTKVRIIF